MLTQSFIFSAVLKVTRPFHKSAKMANENNFSFKVSDVSPVERTFPDLGRVRESPERRRALFLRRRSARSEAFRSERPRRAVLGNADASIPRRETRNFHFKNAQRYHLALPLSGLD